MQSIVSYKDRGAFGNNKYRGNYSGKLLLDLHQLHKFTEISDYMNGGGTTSDVAAYLGIKANTYDLHSGFDLLTEDIKERNKAVLFHSPYWDAIKYSGHVYGDKPLKNDLSHIADYKEFMRAYNYCIAKQFASLTTGGWMYILMADIKKKGQLYSMLLDMDKFGTLEQIVIKKQHNTMSDKRNYANENFIRIVHEYLVILRKDNPYLYNIKITKNFEIDIRNSEKITWKDLLASIHEKIGNAELERVYRELENHKKAAKNPHWKEKIRQTYYIHPELFKNIKKGVWGLHDDMKNVS